MGNEFLSFSGSSPWVQQGLLLRKNGFGTTRRKGSKVFLGSKVVLIEGSNSKGVFLAIQVPVGRSDTVYVVVPAGRKGSQWERVVTLLGQFVNGDASHGKPITEKLPRCKSAQYSYLEALIAKAVTPLAAALQPRLEAIAGSISYVLSNFDLTANLVEEPHSPLSDLLFRVRVIKSSLAALQDLINTRSSAKTKTHSSPAIRSYGSGSPLDPTAPDHISSFFFSYTYTEPESYAANLSHYELDGSHILLTRLLTRLHLISPSCFTMMTTRSLVTTFQTLSSVTGDSAPSFDLVEHSCKSMTFPYEETFDDSIISWDFTEATLVHESTGMRCSPHERTFFTWVSDDLSNLRAIYYTPEGGQLKIANHERKGEVNWKVFLDTDWDRETIYTENSGGYRSDLLSLFSIRFKEMRISIVVSPQWICP